MKPRLLDKTVLVTGASKGIGRAIALACAREGADVIVNYHTDAEGARAVAAEIRAFGRRALVARADVGRPRDIERLFERMRREFPRLDVLVNNAALTGWGELFSMTEAVWDRVFDTNLKGAFFGSVAAARWMRETGTAGAIVNISTNCAALGVKNLAAYAASKAGLHGLTRQLAVELAPYGIRVNTLAPGPTDVKRNLRDDPNYRDTWGAVVPLGRTGTPEEAAAPVVFLASEESSYMTGQVFYSDGGWSVQGKLPGGYFEKTARKNRK